MKPTLFCLALIFLVSQTLAQTTPADTSLRWQPGYFDIHHINTGRGNSTFFIFPDGTTMLLDAGDLNPGPRMRKSAPLKVAPARPNASKTAGQWIVDYVKQSFPAGQLPRLDYLVVSHFHADHYGDLSERWHPTTNQPFQRTGITEVGDLLPVRTIIDRGYPAYNFPVDLRKFYAEADSAFLNYVAFVEAKTKQGTTAEMLRAGSYSQIVLRQRPADFPTFRVQNVKVNGTIWTGNGEQTVAHFTADSVLSPKGTFSENPLCMAFTFSYGPFDYFTGADNTGLRGYGLPLWFDTETPMAQGVGAVDAMTLNHHGNRDASNETFLRTLNPAVVVQQSWCSDQPGQEVMHRLGSPALGRKRDIFALHLQEESKTYLGFWLKESYRSTEGHVLIRVLPGGKQFWVGVLDDTKPDITPKKWYGPYLSRP